MCHKARFAPHTLTTRLVPHKGKHKHKPKLKQKGKHKEKHSGQAQHKTQAQNKAQQTSTEESTSTKESSSTKESGQAQYLQRELERRPRTLAGHAVPVHHHALVAAAAQRAVEPGVRGPLPAGAAAGREHSAAHIQQTVALEHHQGRRADRRVVPPAATLLAEQLEQLAARRKVVRT